MPEPVNILNWLIFAMALWFVCLWSHQIYFCCISPLLSNIIIMDSERSFLIKYLGIVLEEVLLIRWHHGLWYGSWLLGLCKLGYEMEYVCSSPSDILASVLKFGEGNKSCVQSYFYIFHHFYAQWKLLKSLLLIMDVKTKDHWFWIAIATYKLWWCLNYFKICCIKHI